MKFITEGELRDIYRKQPFTAYELTPETKLTPGARQFLTDFQINICGDVLLLKKRSDDVNAEMVNDKPETLMPEPAGKYGGPAKRLAARLRFVESIFLLACKELQDTDISLAQEAIALERQFAGIRAEIEGKGQFEGIYCRRCSGINSENFNKDIGDCSEISELHMALENGTGILNLHKLRCALREIESFVPESYEEGSAENRLYNEVIARVNMIINSLSQMICRTIGGKRCQRIK